MNKLWDNINRGVGFSGLSLELNLLTAPAAPMEGHPQQIRWRGRGGRGIDGDSDRVTKDLRQWTPEPELLYIIIDGQDTFI